jgi:hypothetical protein
MMGTIYSIASAVSALTLAVVLYLDHRAGQQKSAGAKSAPFKWVFSFCHVIAVDANAVFRVFQKQFLIVYGLMVAADWVQGTLHTKP